MYPVRQGHVDDNVSVRWQHRQECRSPDIPVNGLRHPATERSAEQRSFEIRSDRVGVA